MVKLLTYCTLLLLGVVIGGCAAGIVDNEPIPAGDAKEYFWPDDISFATYERDSSGVKQKFDLVFENVSGGKVVGDNSGSAASQLTYRVSYEGIFLENIGKNSIIPLPEGFRLISDGLVDSTVNVPREMKRVLVTGHESLLAIDKEGGMFFSTDTGATWAPSNWNGGKITTLISTGEGSSLSIYAGTNEGIYRSTTLGKDNWKQIVNIRREITAIAVSGSYLYFASGEDVFRAPTYNGDDTLRLSNASWNANVTNLAVVYSGKQRDTTWVIAGTDGDGLFRLPLTQDTNYTWIPSTAQQINKCRALVSVDSAILFALGELSGNVYLLSSIDHGHSWAKVQNFNLQNANLLSYNQAGKLLVSGTTGNTINVYTLPIGNQPRVSTITTADRINGISALDGVLAAAADQGVFRSISNGEEWTNVSGARLTQSATIKVPAPGGLLVLRLGGYALTPDSGWVAGKCEGMVLGKLSTTQINATVLSPLARLDLTAYGSVVFEDVIPVRYSLAPLNGISVNMHLMIFYARGKGPVLIRQVIDTVVVEEIYRLAD